jgi:hypothetical protein
MNAAAALSGDFGSAISFYRDQTSMNLAALTLGVRPIMIAPRRVFLR